MIDPTAIVAEDAAIHGDVDIGAHCVVHPYATLDGRLGPIRVEEYCIVCERSQLRPSTAAGLVVGHHCTVEAGCRIACSIGSVSTIEARSSVGAAVGRGCIITPLQEVTEAVADGSILFSDGRLAVLEDVDEAQDMRGQEAHVAALVTIMGRGILKLS